MWQACIQLALFIAFFAAVGLLIAWKERALTSRTWFYAATAAAFVVTFVLLLPVTWAKKIGFISKILLNIYHTAQVFSLDFPGAEVIETIRSKCDWGPKYYEAAMSAMTVLCPLFTIGVILSFIKDLWASISFFVRGMNRAYIFSDLNEESLAFAESVSRRDDCCIVFANAFAREDEEPDLLEAAERLHAICFKKDITHLPVRSRARRRAPRRDFIMIGENETEKLAQALQLEERCQNRPNTTVKVFSVSPIVGLVIDNKANENIALDEAAMEAVRMLMYRIKELDPQKNEGSKEPAMESRIIEPVKDTVKTTEQTQWNERPIGTMEESNPMDPSMKAVVQMHRNTKRSDRPEEKRREDPSTTMHYAAETAQWNEPPAETTAECSCTSTAKSPVETTQTAEWNTWPRELAPAPEDGKVQSNKPEKQMQRNREEESETFWGPGFWKGMGLVRNSGFYLERIDPAALLAIQTLSDEMLLRHLKEAAGESRTISIMIAGLGSFGKQILKTAVWMYQVEGYTVEINVIDQKRAGESREILRQECPGLLDPNCGRGEGDASYSIRFYAGVDCFSARLDDLLSGEPDAQRLKRTQAVFVTLGDDVRNIDASIRIRRMFDRYAGDLEQTGKPWIYCVVFNDDRQENLRGRSDVAGEDLRNFKKQPYGIHFIGGLSTQYSVNALEAWESLEREAIPMHIQWIYTDHLVSGKYARGGDFKKKLDDAMAQWKPRTPDAKIKAEIPTDPFRVGNQKSFEAVRSEMIQYYRYEYFRSSSVAKYVHRSRVQECFQIKTCTNAVPMCLCDKCMSVRKTEHMRWNAYMRANGYIYRETRSDRAGMHFDLVPWEALNPVERFKD